MAATGLLALLDDITTLLDDVAVYSKVAVKKSAGVLGDDLALNAEQVSGVDARRELPVVWAVARGSFLNKLILVPLALLLSAFLPMLVTPLLMLGGLFLCYEGAGKLASFWGQDREGERSHRQAVSSAAQESAAALLAEERAQIRGAIRTDFILSAEIVVIVLGTVQALPLVPRALTLSLVALAATVGVYGVVAAIVKLDDLGLALLKAKTSILAQALGRTILAFAPWLMRALSVLGTAAMFLVGGSILLHGVPVLAHGLEGVLATVGTGVFWLSMLLEGAVGVLAGAVALGLGGLWVRLRS
jgi:predicted DNA repair protein MutK